MTIDDLDTPAILIEKLRLDSNLASMQQKARDNGVSLRPHIKTHRSVSLGRLQLAGGASGITVAKVGEAESFAAAGFANIRLAYCVIGASKYRRIADLMEKVQIDFCVDTKEGVHMASEFFHAHGQLAAVLIEIDTGQRRCGVPYDSTDVVSLARLVEQSPGLRYVGILTHGGYGYYGSNEGESAEDALNRWMRQERDRMLNVAARLREAGLAPAEISIGSTPTMKYFENRDLDGQRITEIRPGNYVFNDLTQVGLGVATTSQCAMTVLATVVSLHRDDNGAERYYLDAGKKILTSDSAMGHPGFGTLLYNARTMVPLPHADIHRLSEEHAWVSVHGGSTVEVGDRLRVVPNHACVVASTQPRMFVVDGYDVVDEVAVDAQSRSY